MASQFYPKAKEAFVNPGTLGTTQGSSIDWADDNIKVMLVKSGYTYSSAHQYVTDVTGGSYDNGRSANLGTKTNTSGTLDAADTSITATAATACNQLIVFKDTGTDSTSPLILRIDISAFTPSAGQTVTITWDNGTDKIGTI